MCLLPLCNSQWFVSLNLSGTEVCDNSLSTLVAYFLKQSKEFGNTSLAILNLEGCGIVLNSRPKAYTLLLKLLFLLRGSLKSLILKNNDLKMEDVQPFKFLEDFITVLKQPS